MRRGKLEELERSFDLQFWQSQSPQARFFSVWALISYANGSSGKNVRQFRLQRSAATFQRHPVVSKGD
jgi:hypothetical protein